MLPFAFCYAPVVAGAMIATLLDGIPAVSVPYHRMQYDRTRTRMYNGKRAVVAQGFPGLQAIDLAEADIQAEEHHRRRLVELGALKRLEYVFKNVDAPTDRSRVITTELLHKKCPDFFDFVSPYPGKPEPLRVTVWHSPELAPVWAKFFADRDVKK